MDSADNRSEPRKAFPTNAVVGVVDTPRDLVGLAGALREQGKELDVFCSARAKELIDEFGNPGLDIQLTLATQGLFGYEREHTDRHRKAVEDGHFLVLAKAEDDDTVERIGEAFASNGGHFVNYYSAWTSRTLIP